MTDKQKSGQSKVSQEGYQPSKPRPGIAQDGYTPKTTSESKPVSPPPKKP